MTATAIPASIGAAIVDIHAYAARTPVEEAFAWLRANAPVARIEQEGYDPFWVVSKHADILTVSAANARFLNGTSRPVQLNSRQAVRPAQAAAEGPRTLVHMNAPDHSKHRAITQGWFMPKNLRERESRIRAAARRSVDLLLARGENVEFVADLGESYPLHIIMDILGVPEAHEDHMLLWSKQLISHQDPEMRRQLDNDADGMRAHMAVLADLSKYFIELTYERRANPSGDVASIIANSRINGAPISDIDALGYYIIIATAGHDTTSSSTGGAVWQLAEDPALFARVKADMTLIPKLVEEAIRWTTPVQHFMRTAAEDSVLHGQPIAKGDWLYLSYLSGNRDEDVFENATVFDIDRPPNKQISFGYGGHLCLGQYLAKMEMRVLLEELLPRVNSMALTSPPRVVASNFVWGPKAMPMHIVAA